jgi:hypothetical protein
VVRLDRKELAARGLAADVDVEASARHGVQIGPRSQPLDDQFCIDEVREDLIWSSGNADARANGLAYRRDPLSTASLRRYSASGQRSARTRVPAPTARDASGTAVVFLRVAR